MSEAVRRIVDGRLEAARKIWIAEISHAERQLSEVGNEDELAAILFRYQRAAIEGSARLNLRLLAAVAAGQAARTGFSANEFLAWANALEGLRREELILIGAMHRAETNMPADINEKARLMWVPTGKWASVLQAVIPDPFGTEPEVRAAAASAMRSGLIMTTSGSLDDPVTFITTPAVGRLLALAPLEPLMARDNGAAPR
ncbi:hypothetical protein ACVFYP_24710 [Roseomonas sp. F4]